MRAGILCHTVFIKFSMEVGSANPSTATNFQQLITNLGMCQPGKPTKLGG